LDGRGVHFRDRTTGGKPGGDDSDEDVYGPLGWEPAYIGQQPRNGSKFVGWVDDQFFYLDKDAAYAAVQEYAKRGDIPFGIKPRQLWEGLAKSGKSVANAGRVDSQVRVVGKRRWVVQIPRVFVEGGA
jgi:hypothetical protein